MWKRCCQAVAKLLPSWQLSQSYCQHFLWHNFENQQQHQQLLSGHQPVKHQLVSRLITDRQWLDSGPIKSLLLYVKVLNFPSTLPSLRCPPNTVMRIPTRIRWLFLSNPSVLFSSVPWLFFPRCPMHPLPLSVHCHATSSMIFFQGVFFFFYCSCSSPDQYASALIVSRSQAVSALQPAEPTRHHLREGLQKKIDFF